MIELRETEGWRMKDRRERENEREKRERENEREKRERETEKRGRWIERVQPVPLRKGVCELHGVRD